MLQSPAPFQRPVFFGYSDHFNGKFDQNRKLVHNMHNGSRQNVKGRYDGGETMQCPWDKEWSVEPIIMGQTVMEPKWPNRPYGHAEALCDLEEEGDGEDAADQQEQGGGQWERHIRCKLRLIHSLTTAHKCEVNNVICDIFSSNGKKTEIGRHQLKRNPPTPALIWLQWSKIQNSEISKFSGLEIRHSNAF